MPIALSRKAADALAERGVPNARHDAESLLAHVLGMRRLDLYLQYDRPLTGAEVDRYRDVVRRRRKREPLQYILGEVAFRDLVLRVDRRVLIPRPETELVVGAVLEWVSEREGTGEPGESGKSGADRELTALDVGTGSGAIALSLAREGPFANVVATDVSDDALELMVENARRADVSDRVEPRRGSLWQPLALGERFDVIASNPPYIAESDRSGLPPEVRDWEPADSLFADEDGLAVLNALVDGAAGHLLPGGFLALEVGDGQAEQVAGRIRDTDAFGHVETIRDLTGRERIIRAQRESESPRREE